MQEHLYSRYASARTPLGGPIHLVLTLLAVLAGHLLCWRSDRLNDRGQFATAVPGTAKSTASESTASESAESVTVCLKEFAVSLKKMGETPVRPGKEDAE